MKKIKVAVIGGMKNDNSHDLFIEAEKKGFSCDIISMKDVIFKISSKNEFKAYLRNKSLLEYDIFIFRVYANNIDEAKMLAAYLIENSKIVIDEMLGKSFLAGKMFQLYRLSSKNIPVLQTCQVVDKLKTKEILKELAFPIIIKPTKGSQGRGVYKTENIKSALKFIELSEDKNIIQKYVKIDGDYRIFVVGGKVIGAIKRFLAKGDFRSNISVGGRAEKIQPTVEMIRLATKSARILGIEIAGVDLIRVGKKLHVLEVNINPQWQGFKATTGINPGKYIIEYAFRKYQKGTLGLK